MHDHSRPSASPSAQGEIRADRAPVHPAVGSPLAAEAGGGNVEPTAYGLLAQPKPAGRERFAPFDHARPYGLYERVGKQLLDIAAGLLLGVLLLPVMIVLGIALRVMIGRPVLFRQQRIGLNGEIFILLKFRTMFPDRRRDSSGYNGLERRKTHKSLNDPRVTPLGRFLRKWSLDELPQLWNVLRGDMSLVGPRPELISIVARYEPWQHQRHAVKPGLTGLWQISRRSEGLMHEHVGLDLEYIYDLSLSTDLRIMLKTIPAVLGKSYGF